jgi:SAM-dependent methyltransferase
MRAIGQLPEGSIVVDAPCGAGVAFAALLRRQRVRYLALDLSPLMLERARQRALTIDLSQIEFIEGDAERMPLANESACRLQMAASISSSPIGAFTACRIRMPPSARSLAACVGADASSEQWFVAGRACDNARSCGQR